MTTEEDFQRALDRRRSDWQTRLVFADWLDDRDDPRAEGYRALGAGGFVLYKTTIETARPGGPRIEFLYFNNARGGGASWVNSQLPGDWFYLISESDALNPEYWRGYKSVRAAAEDMAALAFAKLPAARRAELLGAVAV